VGRAKSCKKNIVSDMLKYAKYRAKLKKLDFDLTPKDIVIPKTCPVLGIPIYPYSLSNSPSLDRIDNTKGYTKDNVVIVSFKANRMKGAATLDELSRLVNFYKNLMPR
jgi:hypothetical protein